ncbi:MAG: N-6 DNA methylase [Nitriliruptorales bacterium]|nr:N-6 DNA methylase [Nitriliruptorales bacterium]
MSPQRAIPRQQVLPIPPPPFPQNDPHVNHGAVFTRRWVVEFILDTVRFDPSEDLASKLLVEPACGDGAFLLPIAERVIESCRQHGRPLTEAADAVRAFDLQAQHVDRSRRLLSALFSESGLDDDAARGLAEAWVSHSDFLLLPHEEETADFVVGNPPYIRLEDVPAERMAAYKHTCTTMSGRADIYLGFFETGLRLLAKEGMLGFICADRWMRNAYGKHLRQLVIAGYSVEATVEMHDAEAFADAVAAYPAVTVIRRGTQASALVATTTSAFDGEAAAAVVHWARRHDEAGSTASLRGGTKVARLPGWFETDSSWPTGSPQRLTLLRELEDRLRPLESGSTRVGIGVATGADAVFVTDDPLVVEEDRLIPLAMTRDTTSGLLNWGGKYLVNPWAGPRQLVDLAEYPGLKRYLGRHEAALRRRHVAGRRPEQWYRTIDPVHPRLTPKRKLLFPDMKMFAHPVLDPGGHYPHHNLYYVVSEEWDLGVLGGLLMSKVAQFFIEAYAVRMRGGTLRFQAQYLRRIHVPEVESLSNEQRCVLRQAFADRDVESATQVALEAYGLERPPD